MRSFEWFLRVGVPGLGWLLYFACQVAGFMVNLFGFSYAADRGHPFLTLMILGVFVFGQTGLAIDRARVWLGPLYRGRIYPRLIPTQTLSPDLRNHFFKVAPTTRLRR